MRWRGPVIVLATYLVLRHVFVGLTVEDGLLTPESMPNLGVAALGAVVVVLRLIVVFVLPVVVVGRVVAWLAQRGR